MLHLSNMKAKVFVLLFSILSWASAQAIGSYKAGDKLTVLAKSGLSLRANPGSQGKKKSSLPFGTIVTVLAEGLNVTKHEVEEFKGYFIKGHWVKVKVGKEEGWVFDGYLSHLKVIPESQEAKGVSADRDMFDALYSQTSPRKGDRVDVKQENGEAYNQGYEDGSKLTVQRFEGGSKRLMAFKKGISQEEAYLWGKAVWFNDGKIASQKFNGKTKHIRINGTDDNPRALRVIPNGNHWEAHFELAD
jgi:hypothetical protein